MPSSWTPERIKEQIRTIPDFPVPGIRFRDITTLLKHGPAFQAACDLMWERVRDVEFDKVLGIEARGYVFAAVLAYRKGAGLVILRKKGKLPAETVSAAYTLEYGTATVEIHRDAIAEGERVLIVDDLIATGGSARAAADLVQKCGGRVAAYLFLIELVDLKGREKLTDAPVWSLITFTETE